MTHETEMRFDGVMIPLYTYDDSNIDLDGRTDVFPTGIDYIDEYLEGGYGKRGDFEIVVIMGEVKQGKSTFAMNLLAGPIKAGKTVGMFMFEEKYETIKAKMKKIVGEEYIEGNNKIFTHNTEQDHLWTLLNLADVIEQWFTKCDVILVDHLQAIFESAAVLKGDDQWNVQKVFMNRIRRIMAKKENESKAIILVSHISKNAQAKGANKIQGTHGINEYATKVLEVSRTQSGSSLKQWHSRHNTESEKDDIAIYWDYPRLVTEEEAQLADERRLVQMGDL